MSSWPSKDPDEVVDYHVDWTKRLDEGETIATSSWEVMDGDVGIDSSDVVGTVTTVWLSGGTLGTVCTVLNRVTTSGGRTWDDTVRLRIRSH